MTSSSKKALLLILAMATISIGKVFAQNSEHSPFFKKRYSTTLEVANDLAKGKLALVNNMDTLRFINLQLKNWNNQLAARGIQKDDGSTFQLESNFTSMRQARPYFCKILRNYCAEVQLVWKRGEFLVSRVNKKTGEISSLIRANYDGELVATLRTATFDNEISDADGDIGKPDIYGFSLACGNELTPVKKAEKVEKVEKVAEKVIHKEEKRASIVSVGYEVTYDPIIDKGTFATTTAGNNTYNVYNTVNNPPPPPAPPVNKHPNRGIFITAAIGIITAIVTFFLNRRLQQSYQPVMYSPQVYPYQAPNAPVVTYPPIEGNTGTNVYNPPIQGNTGNTVGYNPVQGVTNGTVGYNPIEGGTTKKWVYDSIQGWVLQ